MRALLSVHNKTGIVDFGRGLIGLGFEIVSTGGTLRLLAAADIPVTAVADVTGFPEILEGRVKTLHPAIHGGLLAKRDDPSHNDTLGHHGIEFVDLLACNLYPFEATIAQPSVTLDEAIEQIDIGGPAMIRAGAKNFQSVVVLTDPADYESTLARLSERDLDLDERRLLATRAFAHVAAYDSVVANYLGQVQSDHFADEFSIAGRKVLDLRYGENPHQRAAAYRQLTESSSEPSVLDAQQLAGKPLSYNNLLDANAAWKVVADQAEPTVAIIKHTIPCGCANHPELSSAYVAALAGDPVSAFGGIVAVNRTVDQATAELMRETFFEVIVASGFTTEARATLERKRQLRLLAMPTQTAGDRARQSRYEIRQLGGGFLVQTADDQIDDSSTWTVVTQRQPTDQEQVDLTFAWAVTRHVASNAIVLARDRAVTGVGGGQPNRLESVRIATRVAGSRAAGSILASDAFFPFADGLEAAAVAGVVAVVQPGGSVRDSEVIAAADNAGMSMVFTGTRHFRH